MLKKRILKKFGFETDQKGIINRYMRESEGWDEHTNKTKDFILLAAKNKPKNKAVVLGSGWLLDVPFKELALQFKHLVLVDIVHPRQIEHKLKAYKNIELLETDISCFVEPVYHHYKKNIPLQINSLVPIINDELKRAIDSADFVVSVNLLNQLDILICDFIKKHQLLDKGHIDELRKFIQNYHIRLLPKNKTALITDHKELSIDNNNEIVQTKKLVHVDLPQSDNATEWEWKFDLSKTYHSNYKTIFKVKAISF